MASRKIEDCEQELQDVWLKAVEVWKEKYPTLNPFLTCTYRSPKEQDALYAQGRTKKGNIVTNARAMQSKHNYLPAKAFDIAFKKPDGNVEWGVHYYKEFADVVRAIDPGIIWGGSWKSIKDHPHFEVS